MARNINMRPLPAEGRIAEIPNLRKIFTKPKEINHAELHPDSI
jgi:hypothetical protein